MRLSFSREQLRPHLPTLAFFLSLTIVAIIRSVIVMRHLDMGQDMANYLTTMNTLFGRDVTGTGLLRPPLVAVPLKAFTIAFGDLTGNKLLGVIMSVAIGIPVYLIAKRVSKPWIAVAVSILFVLTPAYSNMLTWGYITMFGIFFTFLSVYCFMLTFESRSKLNALLAGLFGSLVIGFHQLTAAFFVPLCAILVAALLIFNRHQGGRYWASPVLGVFVGIVLSLPYVPVYLHLVQMQSAGGGSGSVSTSFLPQIASGLWYVPWTWIALLGMLGVLASLIPLWRNDKNAAILLATLFLFPLLLLLFRLPAPFVELNRRAHYFLYVPIWATAGYLLSIAWTWRPSSFPPRFRSTPRAAVAGVLTALLLSGAVLSQVELAKGVDFYNYLDETRWEAIEWMKKNTPENAIFVAYPEHLGWWIEGGVPRTDFEVTDRDMEASGIEKERALIAERLMSRNRGMENGYVRIATSYPFTNAAGNPAIGVYGGGKYHDLLMFDDTQSTLSTGGGEVFDLSSATKEFSISGDSTSMRTVISYQLGYATICQTVTLDEGSQNATVTYSIKGNGQTVTSLQLPVLFCLEAKSVLVDPLDGHLEIAQEPKTQFTGKIPVTTLVSFDLAGASLEKPSLQEDRLPLAFNITSADARITLAFDISTSLKPSGGEVVTYEVPQLIKENGIDYLAIDMNGDPPLWSKPPQGLEEWLDACTYYRLAYSEGDIRVYEVDVSALP